MYLIKCLVIIQDFKIPTLVCINEIGDNVAQYDKDGGGRPHSAKMAEALANQRASRKLECHEIS